MHDLIYPFQLAALIYGLWKLTLDYTVALVYQVCCIKEPSPQMPWASIN